jgi:Transposase DDE domain group 1
MVTECTPRQLVLHGLGRREGVARFDAAPITSDGGGVLLREVDRRVNLLGRLAACFVDHRQPELIRHTVRERVAQRVLGLALGYEDLNDHDRLRECALLGVRVGRADPDRPLAGKSTLNRLELTPWNAEATHRYKKVGFIPTKVRNAT